MSVEKFNPRIYGESVPYTQVNTKVIQEINNLEAGFVWVYLLTLPPDWKVMKEHVKNKFNIGQDKLKKIFSYLRAHNLIEYTRERLPNGQLGPIDICVLNGTRFLKDLVQNEPVQTTGVENHPMENHTCGKPTTTNNIYIQKKYKNKENIFCSSDDERTHSFTFFDQFWSHYPRKQKRKEAEKIWNRKNYDQIADIIIKNVKERLQTEWFELEKQFIPLASSFLNGERFKDEVLNRPILKRKEGLTVTEAIKFCLN